MYLLDQYRGTCVSCRYSIPPKLLGPESKDELVRVVEKAIAGTVLKHPVLQVAIIDANSKSPVWAQLETIDLRQHVTWRFNSSAADLDGLLQGLIGDEVDATYPELDTRPGWRITVVRPQDTNLLEILFTYNHPHCDGLSGKIYHESLLQSLNTATPGTDTENTMDTTSIIRLPDSPLELPPPVEDIRKLPLTIPFILKTMWEEWGPTALTAKPTLARWGPIPSPFKTQVRAFTVEADDALANILLACRQHDTTLTGLLHALTLASIASQLPEDVAPAFASGTTVDMRRHVDSHPPACPWLQPDCTMGNFVTIMTHELDRGLVSEVRSFLSRSEGEGAGRCREVLSNEVLDLIWSAAAAVRRELEHRLEMGLRDDIVGVMRFVGDWQQEMASAARRPRRHSWWITGIGVMDGTAKADSGHSDENSWAIQRAQFALSTETTAAAINISPLTVAGERLCVTGSWQDCLFDVSFGERVMADLECWLSQLAQGFT
ncbi:Alcohol acetyltransferase [Diaporthe australafricana]|uniref:Alcohol acetyltransferase n=1 Tax=Diaporthe australafricana TaxID=127596 RepID=A0ABR3X4Z0_9PEZI